MSKQTELTKQNWDDLVSSINKGRCVAIIGPGLTSSVSPKNQEERPLIELLANELATKLDIEDVKDENNLPHVAMQFEKKHGAEKLHKKIESFYSNLTELKNTITYVAGLPVPLFIYAGADHLLFDEVERLRKNKTGFDFFSCSDQDSDGYQAFNANQKPNFNPDNPSETFVYNLFGSIQIPKSMTLTEAHQIKFVSKLITGNNHQLTDLVKFVQDSVLLFIGFDFGAWYARLLFQAFKLTLIDHPEKMLPNRLALGHYKPSSRLSEKSDLTAGVFFENQFGFRFFDFSTDKFLRDLSIRVASPDTPRPPSSKLFVIAADRDRTLAEDIVSHLKLLENGGHQVRFSDPDPGDVIHDWTKKQVEEADFVLLLLSVNFWSSNKKYAWIIEFLSENDKPKAGYLILREHQFEYFISQKWRRFLPEKKSLNNPDTSEFEMACTKLTEELKNILDFIPIR